MEKILQTPEGEQESHKLSRDVDKSVSNTVIVKDGARAIIDIEKHSSWSRAVRVLAWVLRIRDVAKKKQIDPELQLSEVQEAEFCILRQVQRQAFTDTFPVLEGNSTKLKTSLEFASLH
jgi:hypothetical protein